MSAAKIVDAVTAVLVHGEELLIVRRQPYLQAFPGYWAFPGGKVDLEDGDQVAAMPGLGEHSPRLLRALTRELQEELGVDLEALAAAGQVQALHCLGEITTPPFASVRFRTWMFKVELKTRPPLTIDAGELADAEWVSTTALLERFRRGRALMAPPTRLTVEELARNPATTSVGALQLKFDIETTLIYVEPIGGLRILFVRSNTIPPASHTNCFLIGGNGSPRTVIDPSPASREELARLFSALDSFGVDQVFLTHHHPDHREYADEVARRYNIPIGMSADTAERIRKRNPKFFEGVKLRIYADGDTLTHWQGEPVKLIAVPGHDEGQMAPMPESRSWCIVSDLYQGTGTVVVGGPEGNMAKYFESLRKIIALDPAVIIPSHGLAQGTTYQLKKTLEHRVLREQQIKTLYEAGRSQQEMFAEVYQGVDPRLAPLALINIQSHLTKLREEGLIH